MTTIINGSSPSITFSDSTTQTTAGLTSSSTQVCQAWGLFSYNGSGITINASYNVSSITLSATGVYRITMTNAMTDTNYAVVLGGDSAPTYAQGYILIRQSASTATTTSAFTIASYNLGSTASNSQNASFAVFR